MTDTSKTKGLKNLPSKSHSERRKDKPLNLTKLLKQARLDYPEHPLSREPYQGLFIRWLQIIASLNPPFLPPRRGLTNLDLTILWDAWTAYRNYEQGHQPKLPLGEE